MASNLELRQSVWKAVKCHLAPFARNSLDSVRSFNWAHLKSLQLLSASRQFQGAQEPANQSSLSRGSEELQQLCCEWAYKSVRAPHAAQLKSPKVTKRSSKYQLFSLTFTAFWQLRTARREDLFERRKSFWERNLQRRSFWSLESERFWLRTRKSGHARHNGD